MGAMMPSPRTVSQLLLPLSQEPPAGVRRRRSPRLLAAFLLLLLNGSTALGTCIIQVTFSGKGPEFSMPALRFAYNGKDTVHFNYSTEKFVAINPLAKSYVDKLNSDAKLVTNVNRLVNDMPFAMDVIHQALQALTAKPTITITSKHLKNRENTLVLSCQVHGFYPRDIHTTWLRNGMAIDQEVLMTKILPNQDGTFQVQLQVKIDPGKGDTYTCEIKHLSIPDKLHVVWDPKNNYPVYGYVIGIIAGIIGILIAVAGGIIRWKAISRVTNCSWNPHVNWECLKEPFPWSVASSEQCNHQTHHGSQCGMKWIQDFICSNARASVTCPDICSHGENELLRVELDQLPKSASEA